jgi:hypothetical protein
MSVPAVQSIGTPQIRLSELLGALSHALDMAEGQPAGHCVRSCWIGIHIGRQSRANRPLSHSDQCLREQWQNRPGADRNPLSSWC